MGFAFGKDQLETEDRSRFEVYERAFAHYDLYQSQIGANADAPLPVLHWQTHQKTGQIVPEKVLFAHPKQQDWIDANGLAWHQNRESAIKSAFFELIERHMLSLIWYQRQKIVLLNTLNGYINEEHYTSNNAVPFALVVLHSQEQEFWLCGSSVAGTLDQAIQKAQWEAYMLLDSILAQEDGSKNPSASGERLATLKMASYKEHLAQQIISQEQPPTKLTKLADILSHLHFFANTHCLLSRRTILGASWGIYSF